MNVYTPSCVQLTEFFFIFLPSHINPRCLTIEILKINIQHSFDRNQILARMVLLPKKHRTHYSRPKRCSQKVLQTRLLYTFPLKMYQYFKYSNSLLFPFDRSRRVASGLLISDVQAFLQKPSSIIIILIFVNRTLRRIKSSRLIGLVLHAVTFLQGTSQPQRSLLRHFCRTQSFRGQINVLVAVWTNHIAGNYISISGCGPEC